jgi:hypothetical protein
MSPFTIGDVDGSGSVDVSDAVYLCSYMFCGGPPPESTPTADANCDGFLNISDVVYLLDYIFASGDAPGCP